MDLKKILPTDGPPVEEVLKYVEKYKNEIIVIKYGGNVFIDRKIFDNFIKDLSVLSKLGLQVVVVHGGGPRIKRELSKQNIESKFIILKKFLLLICLSIFQISISQEGNLVEINIDASVLDYDSKKGIPFSEVKFINKNLGVLSDSEGNFSLNFLDQNIKDEDVFSITAYGYDTIKTTADKLYKFLNNTNKFFLKKG